MDDTIKELMQYTYFGNTIAQYLGFFGCLILALIIGRIFYFISKSKLRKLSAKSQTKFDDYLIDIIEEPIVLFIFTGGFYFGLKLLTLNSTAEKLFGNIILIC